MSEAADINMVVPPPPVEPITNESTPVPMPNDAAADTPPTAPLTDVPPAPTPSGAESTGKDVVMFDVPDSAASPAPAAQLSTTASPAPGRTGTPSRTNGLDNVASSQADPGFTMPSEAAPNGDSTRKYLNTNVTGALLDGMKKLAKEQPKDPLRVLGQYLIERSQELEGSQ